MIFKVEQYSQYDKYFLNVYIPTNPILKDQPLKFSNSLLIALKYIGSIQAVNYCGYLEFLKTLYVFKTQVHLSQQTKDNMSSTFNQNVSFMLKNYNYLCPTVISLRQSIASVFMILQQSSKNKKLCLTILNKPQNLPFIKIYQNCPMMKQTLLEDNAPPPRPPSGPNFDKL